MRKTAALLALLLFLPLLFACGEGTENGVTSGGELSLTSEGGVSAEASGDESAVTGKSFSVNGEPISSYRIIYRVSSIPACERIAAYELRDIIKEKTGVELECWPDGAALEPSDAELLVGFCDGRAVCEDYIYEIYENRGDHYLAVSGKTVIFAAKYANGAHFAVKEFASLMDENDNIGDMKKKGSGEVINVACIGGSITEGSNSDDKTKNYPAYLQEKLGLDYCVMNFGISGYSIVSTDQFAYSKHSVYKKSLDSEPDVVIFALGCNDCNPTSNQPYKAWEGTDRAEKFVQSTKDLLDSYLALPTKPQIFMCLPCSLFKVGSDGWNAAEWSARIEKYALPLLKQIAEEYKLPVVDLWTWSLDHPEVFADGLHPKNDTYKDYADAVYEAIAGVIKKPS